VTAFGLTEEPSINVLDLTSPALSSELAELEARLHVLQGLLDALGRVNEVNKLVQSSSDRAQALEALQNDPFDFSRHQAEAILDMPVNWQASDVAERLGAERDQLFTRRAALCNHVTEIFALHWFG